MMDNDGIVQKRGLWDVDPSWVGHEAIFQHPWDECDQKDQRFENFWYISKETEEFKQREWGFLPFSTTRHQLGCDQNKSRENQQEVGAGCRVGLETMKVVQ